MTEGYLPERLQSVPSYSDLGPLLDSLGRSVWLLSYVPPLFGTSSVPTTIASELTVIKHVKLNGTEEGKPSLGLDIARPCAPVGPPHRLRQFRVSRNVRSLLERLCTPSSPSPLSSSSSSSALPTPNNQLLSLIHNVFRRQARSPRGHFVHHVGILQHYADGGVSRLLCNGSSCPLDSSSS